MTPDGLARLLRFNAGRWGVQRTQYTEDTLPAWLTALEDIPDEVAFAAARAHAQKPSGEAPYPLGCGDIIDYAQRYAVARRRELNAARAVEDACVWNGCPCDHTTCNRGYLYRSTYREPCPVCRGFAPAQPERSGGLARWSPADTIRRSA